MKAPAQIMTAQLEDFFNAHDLEGSRSVDSETFRGLCSRFSISAKDSDVIFEDLDHDHDGRISFADFSRGFSQYLTNSGTKEQQGTMEQNLDDTNEDVKHHVWTALTTEAERIGNKDSDEAKLKWLLDELQMSEQRYLVPYLETAVEELLGNLKQLQEEKSQLEETWQREKHQHERHLKRMEEELDTQVKDVEMRLRLKAQAEVEDERKSLQSKMDVEMDNLQAHLVLFEKVNSWLQNHPSETQDNRLDEVKSKLDEAVHENRQLRMSLLDTQTSIALVRSELLQLRTLYEEKCRELNSEREKILEVLHEQDHLTRQLNLLHDVNKRLQDANDSLRNSMENNRRDFRQNPSCTTFRNKSGSIVGDYLDHGIQPGILSKYKYNADVEELDRQPLLKKAKSMDFDFDLPLTTESLKAVNNIWSKQSSNGNEVHGHQLRNASDSGVSMAPDSLEVEECSESPKCRLMDSNVDYDEDHEMNSFIRPVETSTPKNTLQLNGIHGDKLSVISSKDCILTPGFPRKKISDIIKELGLKDTQTVSWNRSSIERPKPSDVVQFYKKDLPSDEVLSLTKPVPLPRMSKLLPLGVSTQAVAIDSDDGRCTSNFPIYATIKGHTQTCSDECSEVEVSDELHDYYESEIQESYEPDGPEEQTFKVVFVGDAGVGKSSFALRVSKGVFVRQMSSTLGVDFLMRTLRVDGRNVAVQLWDTAGQERFRSITKSYFRKADGVLLLYDCTCEQSFLNVRQWVEDVDSVSSTKIPLMIVANKIDLRPVALKTGQRCVSTEEGQKLAKDCDTTFSEASAKDGSNVIRALAKLVRMMSSHHELQTTASTMKLCDDEKPKKAGGCCGK